MAHNESMNKYSKTFEVGKKYNYYDHASFTVINGKGVYIPNGYVEIISRNPVAMIEGFVAMNKKALVPVLEVKVNGKKKYAEVHTFNDGSEFSEYEGLHILTNNLKNWGRDTIRFYAQEVK